MRIKVLKKLRGNEIAVKRKLSSSEDEVQEKTLCMSENQKGKPYVEELYQNQLADPNVQEIICDELVQSSEEEVKGGQYFNRLF